MCLVEYYYTNLITELHSVLEDDDSITMATAGTNTMTATTMKRKPPRIRRSLAILLSSLQGTHYLYFSCFLLIVSYFFHVIHVGMVVVIELKDDSEICGILDDVDEYMNVTLTNCRHTSATKDVHESEMTEISGSKIRFVHIPPEIKPAVVVSTYLRKIDRIQVQGQQSKFRDKRPKLNTEISSTNNDDEEFDNPTKIEESSN